VACCCGSRDGDNGVPGDPAAASAYTVRYRGPWKSRRSLLLHVDVTYDDCTTVSTVLYHFAPNSCFNRFAGILGRHGVGRKRQVHAVGSGKDPDDVLDGHALRCDAKV
jgi:hypothetical protein